MFSPVVHPLWEDVCVMYLHYKPANTIITHHCVTSSKAINCVSRFIYILTKVLKKFKIGLNIKHPEDVSFWRPGTARKDMDFHFRTIFNRDGTWSHWTSGPRTTVDFSIVRLVRENSSQTRPSRSGQVSYLCVPLKSLSWITPGPAYKGTELLGAPTDPVLFIK